MAAAAPKLRNTDTDWELYATQSAIDAAKAVVSGDGINARAMISSLSDLEWGWIVAAAIFGWIKARAEQATAEGVSSEITIRSVSSQDPAPWEAGAVASVLPALGEMQGVDWNAPLGSWSKDQITSFAWQIHKLVDHAMAARDIGSEDKIVRHLRQSQVERELSAANGGSLMSREELTDEIPF